MVYFLTTAAMQDKVKIGFSADPEKRRRGFTLPHTKMILIVDGDRVRERELHQQFRRARIGHSEWFYLLPEITQFIRENGGIL